MHAHRVSVPSEFLYCRVDNQLQEAHTGRSTHRQLLVRTKKESKISSFPATSIIGMRATAASWKTSQEAAWCRLLWTCGRIGCNRRCRYGALVMKQCNDCTTPTSLMQETWCNITERNLLPGFPHGARCRCSSLSATCFLQALMMCITNIEQQHSKVQGY